MIDLIKRSTKGEALTWNDLDSNWTDIEEQLNRLGTRELYGLYDIAITNVCDTDGTSTLDVVAKIRIKGNVQGLPMLKGCLVINGKIVRAGHSAEVFKGCSYPLTVGTESEGDSIFETTLHVDDYPVAGAIYIWDEKNNYAVPHTFVIDENPCSFLTLVSCGVGYNLSTYARTINFNADVHGSGSYDLQYQRADVWHTLASFSGTTKRVSFSYPISNDVPIGTMPVRLRDSESGAVSGNTNINFAFADEYTWQIPLTCECDNGQKLDVNFSIAKMPVGNIALEYLNPASGGWVQLHQFSYSYPINLTEIGGGVVDIDLPAGNYNFRIRNLLTGKTLVAENIAVPSCSTPASDITITSAIVSCVATTDYLRRLIINVATTAGSGNYRVQYNDGSDWQDMHDFNHEHGTFTVSFYLDHDMPTNTYDVRILDLATGEQSNTVSVSMTFADTYVWGIEPNMYCDGNVQKLEVMLDYTSVPNSNILLEIYTGGTWQELADHAAAAANSGSTDFGGPITINPEMVGGYNIRVRNDVTGDTLLMPDVTFISCQL